MMDFKSLSRPGKGNGGIKVAEEIEIYFWRTNKPIFRQHIKHMGQNWLNSMEYTISFSVGTLVS